MTPAPCPAANLMALATSASQAGVRAVAWTPTERIRACGAMPRVPNGLRGSGPPPATADANRVPSVTWLAATRPYRGPVVTLPARPAAAGSTVPPITATVTPRPLVVRQACRRSDTSWAPAGRLTPAPRPAGPAGGGRAGGAGGGGTPPGARRLG